MTQEAFLGLLSGLLQNSGGQGVEEVVVLTVCILYDWLVDQIIKGWQMNGNDSSFMDPSCIKLNSSIGLQKLSWLIILS